MKRVAIGVGGRFHSEHLYEALQGLGFDAELFTSFPASRFLRIPKNKIHSLIWPEMVFRVGRKIGLEGAADDYKIARFGRAWAKSLLHLPKFQTLIGWSSFSLEAFEEHSQCERILIRDSLHIEAQTSILREEYERFQVPFVPRRKVIARELKEYELSDKILVLSQAARKSFIERGFNPEKIQKIQLGVDTKLFKSETQPIKSNGNSPLHVVYFGAISIRKGITYLLKAFKRFEPSSIELTLIGSMAPELKKVLEEYPRVKIQNPVPHSQLAPMIRDHDVFVLPSVEDGFGLVVPQAMASGLVPIVSEAAGASDLIHEGRTGFVIPIRSVDAIESHLKALMGDRDRLRRMRVDAIEASRKMDWEQCYPDSIRKCLSGANECKPGYAPDSSHRKGLCPP